jgi:hypothetical protein
MGAGNRYTLVEDSNTLAYQLDVSCDCGPDDYCDCFDCERENLIGHVLQMPLCKKYGLTDSREEIYYGDFYRITFNPSYYGDAIVINLEFENCCENESLQRANYLRCYNKIIRHINKAYPLFVGYGWTRGNIEIGEL